MSISGPDGPTRSPKAIDIDAGFEQSDELGDWRLTGTASIDGSPHAVSLRLRYHGIYLSGERPHAWFSVRADPIEGRSGRGRLLRKHAPRKQPLFELDIHAEPQTRDSAGSRTSDAMHLARALREAFIENAQRPSSPCTANPEGDEAP
jgi:hypothetical protein